MKKLLLLFLILNFSFLTIHAQLKEGEFAIGGVKYEAGNKVIQDLDWGYVLAGGSQSYWGQSSYIIKFDSSGNPKWSRVILSYWGVDIIPVNINQQPNYIILSIGSTYYSYGLTVTRLNNYGRVVWNREISIDEDIATRIKQSKDGKLYFTATDQWISSYNLTELGEIDTSGHFKWGTIIHDSINTGLSYGGGKDLTFAKDGTVLIAGVLVDAGLIRTDTAGKVIWAKNIGVAGDTAYCIINTNDGGYALAGSTSMGAGGRDMYIVKLDSNYNIQWAKTIGGTGFDAAHYIAQTLDGGYAVSGVTNSFGAGQGDVYLVKLDASGNLKWSKTIGGPSNETGNSIVQTFDKGYAICGTTFSFGKGNDDFYFLKLDSNGNSCSAVNAASIEGTGSTNIAPVTVKQYHYGVWAMPVLDTAADTVTVMCKNFTGVNELNNRESNILVYPNPFSNSTTVQFNGEGKHYLEVDDITGRKLEWIECKGTEYLLNRNKLASGIYLLRVFDDKENYIATSKVIVQ